MSARSEKRRRQIEWEARPEVQGARAAGRCGARTRAGKPCAHSGTGKGGRCFLHGGESTGPTTFEAGGRHSKQLAGALAGLWEAIEGRCANDRLLDLNEGIALFDEVRDRLLMRASEESDTPAFRQTCLAAAKEVQRKVRVSDLTFATDLDALVDSLARGVRADQALMEALHVNERRAKRAEAARTVAAREAATVPAAAFEAFTMTMCRLVVQRIGSEAGLAVLTDLKRTYATTRPRGANSLTLLRGGSAVAAG